MLRSNIKYVIPAFVIAATLIEAAPVMAADMVTYVEPHKSHVSRVYHPRVVRTAYRVRPTTCSERIVEYRAPYVPHTQVFRVCSRYQF